MSLAVITVHYQNPSLTRRLIETINDCTMVQKIIVISHDSFSLQSEGKLEFINQENRGYAAGLNRAVESVIGAGIQYVLATNPDVILDCKAVEALLTEHTNSRASFTFPVLSERGTKTFGYRFGRFGSLRTTQDPEWYSGACFLFDVDAWNKIGRFDETFFHYFEDRDFCLKIRKAGGNLRQVTNVIVPHETKSGTNYVDSDLPKFAVRNHLFSLQESGLLNPISFTNVAFRHFLYLFRWKRPWKGISQWIRGIQEFLTSNRGGVVQ